MTFTLDEESLGLINEAAARLTISTDAVVREAIIEFHARTGRLSEHKRCAKLQAFDDFVPRISRGRSSLEVDKEAEGIRSARGAGGRRTPIRG